MSRWQRLQRLRKIWKVQKENAADQEKFETSGGTYDILWVDSDHSLAHMAAAVKRREGASLAEIEARFFGLSRRP